MELNFEKYNTMLPYEKLDKIAEEGSENYKNAFPFSHAFYDEVFDPKVLEEIIDEFETSEQKWAEFDTKYEKKFQADQDHELGPVTRAFIHNLNSEPFLRFLEKLTGIGGLIPDPYLVGAGLHKIPRGGKLGVHIDFNRHKEMRLFRRLNVLIYLNKDWKEEYGGHLQLWDEGKKSCQAKILPEFNRMAMFTTTDTSFHGHPEPLTCPEDRSRKSLALYYYTAEDSGKQVNKIHSTVFLNENNEREELGLVPLHKKIRRKLSSLLRGVSSNDK